VVVKDGLRAGERVVATAAFLLDAESNLGAALAGMAGMAGMATATPAAPPRHDAASSPHAGHTGPGKP
jgi:Cu(I)/Ag(I) efflux system membrane fusion protein